MNRSALIGEINSLHNVRIPMATGEDRETLILIRDLLQQALKLEEHLLGSEA
ncbi:predicted protein [Cyanophage PSS2]|uniref:hypothetical protein n=1 Tax=Cyanophage PSS2 TaxID=658401 RepID=UPI0001B04004|nr:hypothetical protein PSS2_gp047 [Cyanophage PSS2]ACT65609.1 hypothetical protein [Cyanophage PSS2]ACY75752.1 predicted protein [Cyanophage PSS2]